MCRSSISKLLQVVGCLYVAMAPKVLASISLGIREALFSGFTCVHLVCSVLQCAPKPQTLNP